MNNKSTYLTVKDHSVSGETFQLVANETLDILETQPRPEEHKLSEYYKSENYISHTSAKRNVFEFAYHLIRRVTLKRKLKLINSFMTKTKVLLDFGCGTGNFLEIAYKNKWQVTGIEPNEVARDIANKKVNHTVFENDYLKELKPHSFDVITLWHVLEHLPNLEAQIGNIKDLLKPNGRLVVAVPNYKSYDAKHYRAHWAAYDVPRHLWHFSQSGINRLFSKFGFKVEKTLPMAFDAYYVSLLSEKYKSGFMNPFKAFWIGAVSNLKAKCSGEYSSLIYIIKNN